MNLPTLRALFALPVPGGQRTLPFGLDPATLHDAEGKPYPRFHDAVDMAGAQVIAPADAIPRWYPPDTGQNAGVTWFDLIGPGDTWRWRFAHLKLADLDPSARARITLNGPCGRGYRMGGTLRREQVIGPPGEEGLSIGGAHLHAHLLLAPGEYDEALSERWDDSWKGDKMPLWGAEYPGLLERLHARGVRLANEHIGMRQDWRTGRLWYWVDWDGLLKE